MQANPINVLSLLQGTKVYQVPIFQRRYSWTLSEWRPFWDDLRYKLEESRRNSNSRPHFLGNIVIQKVESDESTVQHSLVVDGQQRLVTIMALIAALRDARKAINAEWGGEEYNNKYLRNPYDEDAPHRLVPTEFDQEDFERTIYEGVPQGAVGRAYSFFARQLKGLGGDEVELTASVLLRRFTVIYVETDGDDPVNTIFNTLNSKGRPLLAPDLIRNELLLHLDQERALEMYRTRWLPIERDLVSVTQSGNVQAGPFVTLFWAREIPKSPSLSRKLVFNEFEARLRQEVRRRGESSRARVVEDEIESIWRDYCHYRILRDPDIRGEGLPDLVGSIRDELKHLKRWGSEPHVALSLWVLKGLSSGLVSERDAERSLRTILAFMVYRKLYGIPTNNLNRLISGIPAVLEMRSEGVDVSEALAAELSRPVYRWPSRGESRAVFLERGLGLIDNEKQAEFVSELTGGSHGASAFDALEEFLGRPLDASGAGERGEIVKGRVVEILESLEPGEFTTDEDLSNALRVDAARVVEICLSLDDTLLSLVRTVDDGVPAWVGEGRRQTLIAQVGNFEGIETRVRLLEKDLLSRVVDPAEGDHEGGVN